MRWSEAQARVQGWGNRQEFSDNVGAGCPPPRGCPVPFHRDPAACPRRAGASGKQEGSLGARIPWDGGPPSPGTAASRARPQEHEGVLQTRNRSPHRLLSGKPERRARLLIICRQFFEKGPGLVPILQMRRLRLTDPEAQAEVLPPRPGAPSPAPPPVPLGCGLRPSRQPAPVWPWWTEGGGYAGSGGGVGSSPRAQGLPTDALLSHHEVWEFWSSR